MKSRKQGTIWDRKRELPRIVKQVTKGQVSSKFRWQPSQQEEEVRGHKEKEMKSYQRTPQIVMLKPMDLSCNLRVYFV